MSRKKNTKKSKPLRMPPGKRSMAISRKPLICGWVSKNKPGFTVNTIFMKGRVTMPLLKGDTYTIEDIYELPEGTRAELIDGHIYYMAPPSTSHQRLISRINQAITNHIDANGGRCESFIAPFAVFLNTDNQNYVEPDISVVCSPDKINEKGCIGAPDWIIEIVSPSSRRMDYSIKLFRYRTAGVREYWIVDPEKKRITVHDLNHEDIQEYSFADIVPSTIYPGFSIDFGNLRI